MAELLDMDSEIYIPFENDMRHTQKILAERPLMV
jgi:hypothetical protein